MNNKLKNYTIFIKSTHKLVLKISHNKFQE